MFLDYYEQLISNNDIIQLSKCALVDERVYALIKKNESCFKSFLGANNDPFVSRALARSTFYYDYINCLTDKYFIKIASNLQQSSNSCTGSALSELLGNIGAYEKYKLKLFNYSETYRHLLLSRHPFAQRGTIKCLAYIFADDFLGDAVAQLQYKTDIMNHVNKIFLVTYDFWSWRYSVRAMSLAGGYNEDLNDVLVTEKYCWFVTKAIPIFLTYFLITFPYAWFRHYPMRVQGSGKIPRWLARQRGIFAGLYAGALGVYYQVYSEYYLWTKRFEYGTRYEQEMRRRRAAKSRELPFKNNPYFDSLDHVTLSIWTIQKRTYIITASFLCITMFPLTQVKFPKFMGDVVLRHPILPRLFPTIVSLPTASKCFIPFVTAPFIAASTIISDWAGATPYDFYVQFRYALFKKFRTATEMGG